jgi:hypothetical protein
VITVTEAVNLTKGAFSLERFRYWERVGCPFLGGERLTVIRQDAIVKGGKRIKFVPNAKHYLRKQILDAWKTFRRMARRQGVHVDEHGAIWLAARAAHRKHGVYGQALGHWRKKGYLDAKQLPRIGSGRLDEVWYYRSRGPRSISALLKYRDRCGRLIFTGQNAEASKAAPSAEARNGERQLQVDQAFRGYPVEIRGYSAEARAENKEDMREVVEQVLLKLPFNKEQGQDGAVELLLHTPSLMSTADLASLIGQPLSKVEPYVRRLRERNKNCFEEIENPRKNEPKYLYRSKDVLPILLKHFGRVPSVRPAMSDE